MAIVSGGFEVLPAYGKAHAGRGSKLYRAGQPCGTAVATALPLYHTNAHLVRVAIPIPVSQYYTFEACPECCLPLREFSHKRCEV